MHENETPTNVGLVRRLLAAQFPQWSDLAIERIESSGTVNALYRLGDDMVVRLPRMDWGEGAVEKELEWLPKLAPHLPTTIPVPLAKGSPADGYPWEWGIYPWLVGEHPVAGHAPTALARELAQFVKALRGLDPAGAPTWPRGSFHETWDGPTRNAIVELHGVIDTDAASAAWERALEAPEWTAPLVWVHGDLMPGNLLVRGGHLTGVIDWGAVGLADPAADLMVAWNLLDAPGRDVFRAELGVDDATWERGRGWGLCTGLLALPYYKETNPALAENARYRIGEVLADEVE